MRRGWSLRDCDGLRHQPIRDNDDEAVWTPVMCGSGILLPWLQTQEPVMCPECLAAIMRGTPHDVYPAMAREELRAAVIEGSGRALAEWQRCGESMPTVAPDPAWLP